MSKQDNIYNILLKKHSKLHISNIIEPIIKPFQDKFGKDLSELSIFWSSIIGEDYGKITRPLRISTEYKLVNGGKKLIRKLHIEVSGSNALEIKYNQNLIIKNINQIYGVNFISELLLKQNYKTIRQHKNCDNIEKKRDVKQKINQDKNIGIKNNHLKFALLKLGKQIEEGKSNAK